MWFTPRNSHTLALDLLEYLGGGQYLVIALVAVGAEHGSLSPLCGLVGLVLVCLARALSAEPLSVVTA